LKLIAATDFYDSGRMVRKGDEITVNKGHVNEYIRRGLAEEVGKPAEPEPAPEPEKGEQNLVTGNKHDEVHIVSVMTEPKQRGRKKKQ
jgi:hypothetical protein